MFRQYLIATYLLLISAIAMAQTYLPVTITGYNSDLFAETAPNSLSTTSMSTDLTNHVMYTAGFAAGAGIAAGVVNNGTIVSGTRTYQIAPYNQMNAVYVDVGATQTITLFATGTYSKISLMGFSAEGNSSLNIKLNFTDGSTTNYGNHTLSDWFNGANAVYCCFSRCIRTATAPYNIDGLPSNPRFYPIDISLSCDDQKKNLQTIIIQNMSGTTGFTNAFVLAVSGVSYSQSVFSFANNVTCPGGNNGSINLFVGGTATPFTYSWNTFPVQTTANATNLSAGTYICKITDVNGCITYDTVTVAELPPLTITTQSNPSIICSGDTAHLSVTGLSSFTWQPGGQTSSPATVVPGSTTTYTVTGTDGLGCIRTDSVSIIVNALPLITILPNPVSICEGDSTVLLASGAINYSWSPSTGLSNPNINAPHASPVVTTTYTVTGIGSNNCSNTGTVEVTVKPEPVIVVSANPSTICQGDTTLLTATGLSSFFWNPGGQTLPNIVVSPSATTTYTVAGNAANGCSGQAQITITVNPIPLINVLPAAISICYGDTVQLTAEGGVSYGWSPATGLSDPGTANPAASPLISTNYTVTGENSNGCIATASSLITVYPQVIATAIADPSVICLGESTQLSVAGLSTFTWLPDGQTISPVSVTPLTSTVYTVTGIDNNGCESVGTVVVTVEPLPQVIASTFDTLICNGNNALLTATGNATQYIWSPGSYTGNSITVTPVDSTQYLLTGILGNCVATDTLQVDVLPAPVVTFLPSTTEGCDPLTVSFTDLSMGGTTWEWTFGDGGSATEMNPDHLFHEGIWSITVTVSNSFGCSTVLAMTDFITVYPAPIAAFTVDPPMQQPVELTDATFHFSNQSTGANSFVWDFDDTTYSTEVNPIHTYKSAGLYTVTLAAAGPGGCSDTVSKAFVEVVPATTGFIPNAFTPNGDGLNDVFIPANLNLQSLDLKIFNRWGKVIFQSEGALLGWDGTSGGLQSEAGVYVYLMTLQFENGQIEVHKGNLTLLR
jgi:gliding motility-associated-like protein